MTEAEIGKIVFSIFIIIFSVHFSGFVFEKLKQPRLLGEIFAGVILGPCVLGVFFPTLFDFFFSMMNSPSQGQGVETFQFLYWIGLLLLMFISGSESRNILSKENKKIISWLLFFGIPIPFIVVFLLGWFDVVSVEPLMGMQSSKISTLFVLCIAAAVTSIPVISRIFLDLNIIHTKFASIVLGVAVLEDMVLWGVLAIATKLSTHGMLESGNPVLEAFSSVGVTLLFMAFGLLWAPRILKRARKIKYNYILRSSEVGYLFFILFLYCVCASFFHVNLVFAAFLAGFGLIGGISGEDRLRFQDAFSVVSKIARGVFIPVYFFLVGFKLSLNQDFSWVIFLSFLFGSSLLSFISRGLATKFAGYTNLDALNMAITTNARGGPGIVLATVAFESGLINSTFYTALVLTAIFTSQFAGVWLRSILARGLPLISTDNAKQ